MFYNYAFEKIKVSSMQLHLVYALLCHIWKNNQKNYRIFLWISLPPHLFPFFFHFKDGFQLPKLQNLTQRMNIHEKKDREMTGVSLACWSCFTSEPFLLRCCHGLGTVFPHLGLPLKYPGTCSALSFFPHSPCGSMERRLAQKVKDHRWK